MDRQWWWTDNSKHWDDSINRQCGWIKRQTVKQRRPKDRWDGQTSKKSGWTDRMIWLNRGINNWME